jgi:hypothetical protein
MQSIAVLGQPRQKVKETLPIKSECGGTQHHSSYIGSVNKRITAWDINKKTY